MDLRFLEGKAGTGIAYLAATAYVDQKGTRVRYRGAPLKMPRGIYRMPVLRIEARSEPSSLEPLLDACKRLIADGGTNSLQIDFDLPASLRPTYTKLLEQLRRTHGAELYLSITLLAGWCEKPWFQSLPVSEHVVMLFRLGKSGTGVRDRAEQNRGFALPACKQAVGYSTDERPGLTLDLRRTYWFTPTPWSAQSYNSLPSQPRSH